MKAISRLKRLADTLRWLHPLAGSCPSSNDLRLLVLWKNGVSGSDCGLI
jgi:hypothetical protein